MQPQEFMQRLAALVPRPQLHLIRFHGALAPHAKLRAATVPQPAQKTIYHNRVLAMKDIADYIESFSNRTRRHSHLGGVSPEQFEKANRPRRKSLH